MGLIIVNMGYFTRPAGGSGHLADPQCSPLGGTHPPGSSARLLPFALGLPLASWLRTAWRDGAPPVVPFAALALRAAAPFPTLSRFLVLSLAQIHALRSRGFH
jgi:hypothetical protein